MLFQVTYQLVKSYDGDYMVILKWGLSCYGYVVVDICLVNDAILTTVFTE
jgi:hypothetical protein